LQLVMEGHNVFFTGNAGTGKTFMLNQIIAELKRKYGRDFAAKVALAAPTGIAATHIQGKRLAVQGGKCGAQQCLKHLYLNKDTYLRCKDSLVAGPASHSYNRHNTELGPWDWSLQFPRGQFPLHNALHHDVLFARKTSYTSCTNIQISRTLTGS